MKYEGFMALKARRQKFSGLEKNWRKKPLTKNKNCVIILLQ